MTYDEPIGSITFEVTLYPRCFAFQKSFKLQTLCTITRILSSRPDLLSLLSSYPKTQYRTAQGNGVSFGSVGKQVSVAAPRAAESLAAFASLCWVGELAWGLLLLDFSYHPSNMAIQRR